MKIAQIAPVIERIPPKKYGGTERVVYHLTEELVKRGHDVTLFASGDSITSAKLFLYTRALCVRPSLRTYMDLTFGPYSALAKLTHAKMNSTSFMITTDT